MPHVNAVKPCKCHVVNEIFNVNLVVVDPRKAINVKSNYYFALSPVENGKINP